MTIMRTVPAALATGSLLLAGQACATDLTGAWSTDQDACSKMFAARSGKISFRNNADVFGGGFIVDGQRIRGPAASCKVTKTVENDNLVHMIASCATDIMLSTVQFSVKVLDENKISRIYPGVEGMEMIYYRCPATPTNANQGAGAARKK